MRSVGVIIVCLVILLSLSMDNGIAQNISSVSRLNHSGDIAGTVVCSSGSDVNDVLVFIPGHSFMVKTDAQGSFRIYNVPEGTYDLVIEVTPEQSFSMFGIVVRKKRVTTVGIDVCENSCSETGDCPAGTYCSKAVGDCSGDGTCREIPMACPDVWDPVCGCDGFTYGNSCEAAAAGVNIASPGECGTKDICNGNADCPEGYYCAKEPGDCEGRGTIRKKPELCTMEWAPVCGCDNRMYSNACDAASKGVNVAYEGACMTPVRAFPGD